MREENLTLQMAIDICRANEASESQITNKVDEKAVNQVVAQGADGGRQPDRGNSRHTHSSNRHIKGINAGNDKENVNIVEVRMLEETV